MENPPMPATGGYRCPVSATLQLIGGKWKMVILWAITHGIERFGQMERMMPGISKKVLTQELRDLERLGLIEREQVQAKPLIVVYSVTPLGQSLEPILQAMGDWGAAHAFRLLTPSSGNTPSA